MNQFDSAFRRGLKRPLIIGHRGARAVVQENTIAAFEQAMNDGADGVELDVRLTACGTLVIHHDATVIYKQRTIAISELSYGQLLALRPLNELRICTLKDALDWGKSRNALMNIELKGEEFASLYMTRKAAQLAQTYNIESLLFSSFDIRLLLELRRCAPEVSRGLLTHEEQRALNQLLKWIPVKAIAGACALHPQVEGLTSQWLQGHLQRGTLINIWTVMDDTTARQMSHLGVNALICDDPARILGALNSKSDWPAKSVY